MNAIKRLSLEDFKLKKLDSRNEIDKLLGGVADTCHTYYTDKGYVGTTHLVQFDDDCVNQPPL